MVEIMTPDELFATGATYLKKGDLVNIVGPEDTIVAGPLTVEMVLCVIGDWMKLTDEAGATFLEGNMVEGDRPADLSRLPDGWRFEKL